MDKSKLLNVKKGLMLFALLLFATAGFSTSDSNITFQIFVLYNGTNITYGDNYSIKVIDSYSGFVVLDNSTGSTRAYADENGSIVLNNSAIENYKTYLVVVYDSNDTIVLKKSIYVNRYVPIWIKEGETSYPSDYQEMVTHTLQLPFLAPLLFLGITLMFIKLFKFSIGLMVSGATLLGFTLLIYDMLPEGTRLYIIVLGMVITTIGYLLTVFRSRR